MRRRDISHIFKAILMQIILVSSMVTKAALFKFCSGVTLISLMLTSRKKAFVITNGGSTTTFTGLDRMGPAAENY